MAEPAMPLPAASILLVRDTENGLEVLMQERPKTMSFAPGAFVFPGGKVDAADSLYPTTYKDGALRVSAIRELYEEAGVLLAEQMQGKPDAHETAHEFIINVNSSKLALALDSLVFFAHWVTPEVMPKRFDTHFYLAHDIHSQTVAPSASETVSTHWLRPGEVLRGWEEEKLPLMFPTRLNLMKLARWNTVKEALECATSLPVYRVLPSLSSADGVRTVSIPDAAGYGVTHASQREMSVERREKQ